MNETTQSQDTISGENTFDTESSAREPDAFGERMADVTQSAKEQLGAAKARASAAAQPIAEKARIVAEEQRQSSAERVEGVAGAVHNAADEIGKEVPQLAGYVHSGAKQLERAAHLLRENSIDELLQMTNRLAQDRPLAFIGGSVAAGFILARFLKSSGSMLSAPDVQS